MTESNHNAPATVPEQPESKPPLRKGMPVILALIAILVLIGIANFSSLVRGNKRSAPSGTVPISAPAAPNAQQVNSFEAQQELQAKRAAQKRQYQKQLAAAEKALQAAEATPGPEGANVPPMTSDQSKAIYGNSPNAPQVTSEATQEAASATERELAKQREHRAAINSDTVAVDFEQAGAATNPSPSSPTNAAESAPSSAKPTEPTPDSAPIAATGQSTPPSKTSAMAPYSFDKYHGRLYRIFEGTVLDGVVANRIDGEFSGPVLVMLTTNYYSHNHQHLLLPQGTRLIGTVHSVGSAQQRKMFVVFHRAICPDGFSLSLDNFVGLDQMGTTGLATKVHHGYLAAFGAAAAIGGLGGLAQIGNNGNILTPSTEIRNGISAQSATEGEQVLNHFLDRLPVITLKEGSRVRIYVTHDILVPSYSEHRVNPNL